MSKIDPVTHTVGVYGSILLIFCLYNRKYMPDHHDYNHVWARLGTIRVTIITIITIAPKAIAL